MHALWMSLKKNSNCGSTRLTDAIIHPEKYGNKRCCIPGEQESDSKLTPKSSGNSSFREVINTLYHKQTCFSGNVAYGDELTNPAIHREKNSKKKSHNPGKDNLESKLILRRRDSDHTQTRFCVLTIGDPARNIIQMIFESASKNPSKKIKKALKVKNPIEILERFEKHRDMVKKHACEQHMRHPRSIVDGNELLRFYGTTMSCNSKKLEKVSGFCSNPTCGVCRIIESDFDTEYTKKYGIRLSPISDEFCDDMISFAKKMQRAVIMCRIIAGTLVEECNSTGSAWAHSNSESVILRNPCAVLPCFVIVFI